jgi:hypothetical protein
MLSKRAAQQLRVHDQHDVVELGQRMARASLQMVEHERRSLNEQYQANMTSMMQAAMNAMKDGVGTSGVAIGSDNSIGKVWRPDFKSVGSLMRDKTFKGDPGALRAFIKHWDGAMEGLTSLRPDSVIPDDHRNVLIWSTLDHNVAETMDSKTVMVYGVEQHLKTHGTYNQVMAA